MAGKTLKSLLTLAEAAQVLGLGHTELRNALSRGEYSIIREKMWRGKGTRGYLMIKREYVEKYLDPKTRHYEKVSHSVTRHHAMDAMRRMVFAGRNAKKAAKRLSQERGIPYKQVLEWWDEITINHEEPVSPTKGPTPKPKPAAAVVSSHRRQTAPSPYPMSEHEIGPWFA